MRAVLSRENCPSSEKKKSYLSIFYLVKEKRGKTAWGTSTYGNSGCPGDFKTTVDFQVIRWPVLPQPKCEV
jgi:hypothetical protein